MGYLRQKYSNAVSYLPLCRTDTMGVLQNDDVHEAICLWQMHRYYICRQYDDTCLSNVRRYSTRCSMVSLQMENTMGWRHCFRLHLVCNNPREIITFCFTVSNVNGRDVRMWTVFTKELYSKVFDDRGYIKKELFINLFNQGTH